MKTQTTIRVEQENYHKAKKILAQMGLNYSQAINVFNSMVALNKSLPFEVKIPNTQTLQAMEDVKTGKNYEETSL